MSTSKKLTQIYTTEKQKVRLKNFILESDHFEGHMNSMSKITWLMMEFLMSLESKIDFSRIHDDSTFKKQVLAALEKCDDDEKQKIVDFNVY